jgi:hypothetical protein
LQITTTIATDPDKAAPEADHTTVHAVALEAAHAALENQNHALPILRLVGIGREAQKVLL